MSINEAWQQCGIVKVDDLGAGGRRSLADRADAVVFDYNVDIVQGLARFDVEQMRGMDNGLLPRG